MRERLQAVDIGIQPADAEQVTLAFASGSLVLAYQDWAEKLRRHEFKQVLGFRWQEFDLGPERDDMTYEVMDSAWLHQQARLHAEDPAHFRHLKVCFNAAGMLDVLCREVVERPAAN